MVRIAVVYSSEHQHTALIAEHVAKGAAAREEAEVDLIRITGEQLRADGRWDDPAVMARLDLCDAVIFGAPTYMGSAHGVFKLFLEATFLPRWLHQDWKDKLAGGFTNSASRSGDKLIALQQFTVFAAQMGMVWVGVGDPPGGNRTDSTPDDVNQLGSWLGLMSQSPATVDGHSGDGFASEGDRHTAERYGWRIATAALRWKLGEAAYPPVKIAESEGRRRDQAGLQEWRAHVD